MSKQVRVNIRAAVNAAKIRTEKRNGREVMVIPSATLPDGVVMNGIRYGAEAIAASFKTLDRTLAPLGHPVGADGGFLSAKDPEVAPKIAFVKNALGGDLSRIRGKSRDK